MKLLLLLLTINISYAYSPLVATPACWDGKRCELADRVFDESCPTLKKGKGYCSEKFFESFRISFFSNYGKDRKFHFVPDFTFTDDKGKIAYQYNKNGVFFKGKIVCKVTPFDAIPYIGENKPCPYFFDGPVRYLSSRSHVAGGAILILDHIEDNKGWVYYKDMKLHISLDSYNKKDHSEIQYTSKKIGKDFKENSPSLSLSINKHLETIEQKGLKFFIENMGENFHMRSDPEYGELSRKDIYRWYQSNPLFKKIFQNCLTNLQWGTVGNSTTINSKKKNIDSLHTGTRFILKNEGFKYPISISCFYSKNKSSVSSKIKINTQPNWNLSIYMGAFLGDGDMTIPARWLY